MIGTKSNPERDPSLEEIFAFFDKIKATEIEKTWKPEKVFLFSGHMIDQPDREEPRFPPGKEAAAVKAIRDQLTNLGVGPNDLAICGGACGGDLIFAEEAKKLGAKIELRLPYPSKKYLKGSVRGCDKSGKIPSWESRFMDIWNDAGTRRFDLSATGLIMPENMNVYAADNLWMLHEALSYGPENLYFVCLWNGKKGDGAGGTEHMYNLITEMKGKTFWIDTREL